MPQKKYFVIEAANENTNQRTIRKNTDKLSHGKTTTFGAYAIRQPRIEDR